jgi:hypothetical protein
MRLHLFAGAVVPTCILFSIGCLASANPAGQTTSAAQSTVTSSASSALTPGPAQAPGAVGAQASPIPVAVIDVSPGQVPEGGVSLSLAFEPARHMQDQTAALAAANQPQPAAPQATLTAGPPSQGALVLSDMLHVTNNLDPTQPSPPDSAQSIVRQAVVQIVTSDTHQLVPYLTVTMDLLLDGHPVSYGQTLVPMLTQDTGSQRVYYGNNVRLPARGNFQVFVRMDHTALLGPDTPGASQFNVVVH